MNPLYVFLFCLGLGIAARPLFMLTSALAKKTDLIPVTVALDFFVAAAVGGALTAFIILSGAQLAPYVFAALGAGYLLAYAVTRRKPDRKEKAKE